MDITRILGRKALNTGKDIILEILCVLEKLVHKNAM